MIIVVCQWTHDVSLHKFEVCHPDYSFFISRVDEVWQFIVCSVRYTLNCDCPVNNKVLGWPTLETSFCETSKLVTIAKHCKARTVQDVVASTALQAATPASSVLFSSLAFKVLALKSPFVVCLRTPCLDCTCSLPFKTQDFKTLPCSFTNLVLEIHTWDISDEMIDSTSWLNPGFMNSLIRVSKWFKDGLIRDNLRRI